MDTFVLQQYRNYYCNKKGIQTQAIELEKFYKKLAKAQPSSSAQLRQAVDRWAQHHSKAPWQLILQRLGLDICMEQCNKFQVTDEGRFADLRAVQHHLSKMRLDLKDVALNNAINKWIRPDKVSLNLLTRVQNRTTARYLHVATASTTI